MHHLSISKMGVTYLGFFVCGIIMLTKVCTKCFVEKCVNEYHKYKKGRHGVVAVCKPCVLQYRHDHYEKTKELELQRNRVYKKNNPHIFNARSARRRASKLQATPSWANKEHIASIYLLASINRKVGYDVQVDHIVPLQSKLVCGLHCESNLQLLQGSNNISKGNRHWPDQW